MKETIQTIMELIRELSWGDSSEYYVKLQKKTYENENCYVVLFCTPALVFDCDVCKTNQSNRCKCKDSDWSSNKLHNFELVSSRSRKEMMHVYHKISAHLDDLRSMDRSEVRSWTQLIMSVDSELVCNY